MEPLAGRELKSFSFTACSLALPLLITQPGVGYEISASFTDIFVRIGNTQIEALHRLVEDFTSIAPGRAKKVYLLLFFIW